MSLLIAGLVVDARSHAPPSALPLNHGLMFIAGQELSLISGAELPAALVALATERSNAGRVVYVEAESFGGVGAQASVGWELGKLTFGPVLSQTPGGDYGSFPVVSEPAKWAINQALEWLGVRTHDDVDAFEAVGFTKRRNWLADR